MQRTKEAVVDNSLQRAFLLKPKLPPQNMLNRTFSQAYLGKMPIRAGL
jgi:hypothetical protein